VEEVVVDQIHQHHHHHMLDNLEETAVGEQPAEVGLEELPINHQLRKVFLVQQYMADILVDWEDLPMMEKVEVAVVPVVLVVHL
jgi:hypothetical protein